MPKTCLPVSGPSTLADKREGADRRAILRAAAGLGGILALTACVGPGDAGGQSASSPVSSDDAPAAVPAEGRGVSGVVVGASGSPVAGALVVPAAQAGTTAAIPEIAVITGADGRFFWPLPAGSYRLTAMIDGAEAASGDVTVASYGATALRLVVAGR